MRPRDDLHASLYACLDTPSPDDECKRTLPSSGVNEVLSTEGWWVTGRANVKRVAVYSEYDAGAADRRFPLMIPTLTIKKAAKKKIKPMEQRNHPNDQAYSSGLSISTPTHSGG